MAYHELKCWPAPFQAMKDGVKAYEVRKNDRGFAVGDDLYLREFDPETSTYSGRVLGGEVTFMTNGGTFGLPDELCVLGVAVVR
jgi:hypothetical protein